MMERRREGKKREESERKGGNMTKEKGEKK